MIARATCSPWAFACSMCSTRMRRPPCVDARVLAHVAGGPDARRARAQALVAAHAARLAELEPGGPGEHDVRRDADAADDEAGRQLAPAGRDDALDALLALEPRDLVGVDDRRRRARRARRGRRRRPVRPSVRSIGSSSSITIVTCLPSCGERRRDLAADVGAADADDVLDPVELAADRVGVAVGAHVVDAVELRPVDLEPADHRARRDERVLVADRLLRGQRRLARLRVELHDARARQQLDGRVVEPARPAGGARPRARARRAGTPSSAAGARRAGRARGRRAARCRRSRRSTSSCAAAAEATPPPMSRTSTVRSAMAVAP